MAWRVIDAEGQQWLVQPAAERRPNVRMWQLMLSFRRMETDEESRTLWAPYPMESSSKSSLFEAAERLSDETLREILSQHLS
jgi:hypothetical protein